MDSRYINTEINPKEDFYAFAAGKWPDYNPQPADEPRWSNFDVIDENVTNRLKELFDSLDENDPMQHKIASYKRIYTNYEKRNDEGISVLRPYIEHISTFNSKLELLKWFTQEFNEDLFCSVYITQDLMDSTRHEVCISQSLDLDNRDYYVSQNPENVEIRKKYRQVNIDLLMMAGYSKEHAEELFNIYFTAETEIAKVAYSQETLQKPEENYHRYSIAELTELIGFDAKVFLSWSDFNETSMVIVAQPAPIKRAFELINGMSLEHLKDIIEYSLVISYCGSCSEDFTEKSWEFSQFMTGAKERSPKWKREVNHLNSTFYEPVGRLYSERYFSPEAKEKIMSIVHNVRDAYREIISEQQWMSETTRQRALEKMDAMKFTKIAYPENWEDYTDIPIDESKSFLDNVIAIDKWSHQRSIKKYYNKPVDREEWPMMPQTVNACCMQQQNELCFPAAILQSPFFDADADDASNYGAIGVVIGHEMTHNFDMAGRLFSKDGDMIDWWEDGDDEKFKALTENTLNRFNSLYAIPWVKCNGELTLNENIADYGGLKIAYRALEKVMDKQFDVDANATGYNWKQRFFISYAQMWACVATDETIKRQIQNDPHSVPSVRTNGTLPMFTPWYDAWGVSKGDKLFVDESQRGQIW